jgi:hypothetical protein
MNKPLTTTVIPGSVSLSFAQGIVAFETFSHSLITRAALSTGGRAKSNFLSAKVKSCWSEGESPSGLAESRRSLERKN